LASSGLRHPERIDRFLLMVAIAVLVSSLQGFAISVSGLRRHGLNYRRSSMLRAVLSWSTVLPEMCRSVRATACEIAEFLGVDA
jgi:hypothetical protein